MKPMMISKRSENYNRAMYTDYLKNIVVIRNYKRRILQFLLPTKNQYALNRLPSILSSFKFLVLYQKQTGINVYL